MIEGIHAVDAGEVPFRMSARNTEGHQLLLGDLVWIIVVELAARSVRDQSVLNYVHVDLLVSPADTLVWPGVDCCNAPPWRFHLE